MDSDEAIFGIMACDILRGDFPVFFYGQDYMGSFQAFAAVPLLLLFGKTPLALRMLAIVEGLIVLLFARRILLLWRAPRGSWLFFTILLAFSSDFVTDGMLRSRGNYVIPIAFAWMYAATLLTLVRRCDTRSRTGWFLLGVMTALGWWTSQLILFFYVPTMIAMVSSRRARTSLAWWKVGASVFQRSIGLVMFAALGVTLALLIARGTISYQSPLSSRLFEARWALLGAHVLAVVAFAWASLRWRWNPWPIPAVLGFLACYAVPLSATFAKPVLYNTTGSMSPWGDFLTNLGSLILIDGGSLVGLLRPDGESLGLPVAVSAVVVAIHVLPVLWTARMLAVHWRRKTQVPFFLIILPVGLLFSLVLYCRLSISAVGSPRYAFYGLFFMIMLLGCFLASMRQFRHSTGIICLCLLGFVNLHSVWSRPAQDVVLPSLVLRGDARIIEFLVDHDIHVAATSLNASTTGYWEAYRLSFSSGERVIVHPILHMPRVDRYRQALRDADRCAIVTNHPEYIASELEHHRVAHKVDWLGPMAVIWDFDKGRVDELGLISYDKEL